MLLNKIHLICKKKEFYNGAYKGELFEQVEIS